MSEVEMYQWKEKAESYLDFDFSLFEEIVSTVKDGWNDPLKAYLLLDRIEKASKQAKENILENAVREAEMYDKGKEIDGYKVTKINSAGKWDFSKIKSWNEKKYQLKQIEERYKSAYANWQKGLSSIDEETGEQIEIPVYVEGKETVKITILK